MKIAREAFLADAIAILDLPDHRKREADWFKSVRMHPITEEKTDITQATIYVEERPESELAFGASESLERKTRQKVLEVGIACDAKERIVETPRRDVMLNVLRITPDFEVEPADGIERIEISSLEFFAQSGGFPATALAAKADTGFKANGFERRHWKSTEPVRKLVNKAFTATHLTTFGPHAFRHMLARHAANTCTSVAELVATSQNLGHTDVLTTLRSYGQISRENQRSLITRASGKDVLDD